jgi:hypothetical protein
MNAGVLRRCRRGARLATTHGSATWPDALRPVRRHYEGALELPIGWRSSPIAVALRQTQQRLLASQDDRFGLISTLSRDPRSHEGKTERGLPRLPSFSPEARIRCLLPISKRSGERAASGELELAPVRRKRAPGAGSLRCPLRRSSRRLGRQPQAAPPGGTQPPVPRRPRRRAGGSVAVAFVRRGSLAPLCKRVGRAPARDARPHWRRRSGAPSLWLPCARSNDVATADRVAASRLKQKSRSCGRFGEAAVVEPSGRVGPASAATAGGDLDVGIAEGSAGRRRVAQFGRADRAAGGTK